MTHLQELRLIRDALYAMSETHPTPEVYIALGEKYDKKIKEEENEEEYGL